MNMRINFNRQISLMLVLLFVKVQVYADVTKNGVDQAKATQPKVTADVGLEEIDADYKTFKMISTCTGLSAISAYAVMGAYTTKKTDRNITPLAGLVGAGAMSAAFLPCYKMVTSIHAKKVTNRLINALQENCKTANCKVVEVAGKKNLRRITYIDGRYFDLDTSDSFRVVVPPVSNEEEANLMKKLLEKDLFGAAEKAQLNARVLEGTGTRTEFTLVDRDFENRALITRNLIVDQLNHSELVNGILSEPKLSSDEYRSIRSEINQAIKSYDNHEFDIFNKVPYESSQHRFISSMANILSLKYGMFHPPSGKQRVLSWQQISNSSKMYKLLNDIYESQGNSGRNWFEVASGKFNIQFDGKKLTQDQYDKLMKLHSERFNYIRSIKEPIPFLNEPTPLTSAEKADLFKKYVEESGLKYSDYVNLVPAHIKKDLIKGQCVYDVLDITVTSGK